jgi:uracil-DNA glycosylase
VSLFSTLHPEWQVQLADHRAEIEVIEERISLSEVLPAKNQIFRALTQPVSSTKILIVGQDPYPNPEYPCGLAFSVNPHMKKIPASVQNILKEVVADIGKTQIISGDLAPWHEQGVMLLNRVLTVAPRASGSHAKLGWQTITTRVAEVLNERQVVAILWGSYAQELASIFKGERLIVGVHPSPLSAYRGFFGSKPFSTANKILANVGKSEVIW